MGFWIDLYKMIGTGLKKSFMEELKAEWTGNAEAKEESERHLDDILINANKMLRERYGMIPADLHDDELAIHAKREKIAQGKFTESCVERAKNFDYHGENEQIAEMKRFMGTVGNESPGLHTRFGMLMDAYAATPKSRAEGVQAT